MKRPTMTKEEARCLLDSIDWDITLGYSLRVADRRTVVKIFTAWPDLRIEFMRLAEEVK